jgi:hypothetical protein
MTMRIVTPQEGMDKGDSSFPGEFRKERLAVLGIPPVGVPPVLENRKLRDTCATHTNQQER